MTAGRRKEKEKMNKKLKAIFIGGPNDGQTWELDEANQEVAITHSVLEKTGKWREIYVAKYRLKSNESPLRYEFKDPN